MPTGDEEIWIIIKPCILGGSATRRTQSNHYPAYKSWPYNASINHSDYYLIDYAPTISCATAHAKPTRVASLTNASRHSKRTQQRVSCFLSFGSGASETFARKAYGGRGARWWSNANNMFDLTIQNRNHHQSGSHSHHEYVSVCVHVCAGECVCVCL